MLRQCEAEIGTAGMSLCMRAMAAMQNNSSVLACSSCQKRLAHEDCSLTWIAFLRAKLGVSSRCRNRMPVTGHVRFPC